jgi:hypothetical protein
MNATLTPNSSATSGCVNHPASHAANTRRLRSNEKDLMAHLARAIVHSIANRSNARGTAKPPADFQAVRTRAGYEPLTGVARTRTA